eukprot:CAMPEP_0201651066 /NCGR_PEP_ID=MMETSP0493-20130528/42365_1 /ASSEMBLY_ACC=CAM_ASM_000838 /TAXON_ID=420259 /ORGANISM="Thalassiosira gravida, Strain GMp14c1" /LENGTH=105 /DNA_ID=CAMNT_0048127329 /DNA_START=58 /DNA_END=375 /DNA_ORIENTATION=+
MTIEFDTTILVALLVGAAVVAVGLLVLTNQQKKTKQLQKREAPSPSRNGKTSPPPPPSPKKTPTKSTPPRAAKMTRSLATGSGSVRTPAGRRSARLARKSLEHND